ncbi:MAG: DNA methyltransferase, partial [Opitutaceae bacterium]
SVDAVITDPPYFDFVHYSELSDFFFAWLAPVLKSRYSWFERPDSSDKGEVQHQDPRVFARQLGSVFSECRRVLKSDGVLAFSFHHSRVEGWAAIFEAIASAGLVVVAAHPVHAELRAARPKAAAKDPISLDAILVCRKRSQAGPAELDQSAVIQKSVALADKLQWAGISVSASDRFVIVASQMLVALSNTDADFDSVCDLLKDAR